LQSTVWRLPEQNTILKVRSEVGRAAEAVVEVAVELVSEVVPLSDGLVRDVGPVETILEPSSRPTSEVVLDSVPIAEAGASVALSLGLEGELDAEAEGVVEVEVAATSEADEEEVARQRKAQLLDATLTLTEAGAEEIARKASQVFTPESERPWELLRAFQADDAARQLRIARAKERVLDSLNDSLDRK